MRPRDKAGQVGRTLGKGRKPKEQIPQPPVLHPLSSCQPNSTRNQEARKSYFCFTDYAKAFDCVDHNKLWKILKEVGIPDHLTCLLRNLYAGQEATVKTGHETTDWFQIGKGSTSRMYIVTLLIELLCRVHHEKCWAGGSTSWNQDCQEKDQ